MDPEANASFTVPELDFTNVPIDQSVSLLQRLATVITDAIFDESERPILLDLLSQKETELFLRQRGSALGSRSRGISIQGAPLQTASIRVGAFLRRWQDPLMTEEYGETISAGRRGQPREIVHARLLDEVERRVGGVTSTNVPTDLWPLVSQSAWMDLEFQNPITEKVHDVLRKTYLFKIGQMPKPDFSPQVYWMLILIARSGSLGWWEKLTRAPRIRLEGVAMMRAVAEAQVLKSPWARVWDQWIIMEAIRVWPDARYELGPHLSRAVMTLPLKNRLSPGDQVSTSGMHDRAAADIVHSDWDRDLPDWLRAWG